MAAGYLENQVELDTATLAALGKEAREGIYRAAVRLSAIDQVRRRRGDWVPQAAPDRPRPRRRHRREAQGHRLQLVTPRRLFVAGSTGAVGRVVSRPRRTGRSMPSPTPGARAASRWTISLRSSPRCRAGPTVVQLIGTIRARFKSGDTYETSDIGTTRQLVDAAKLAGSIDHIVLLSSVGAGRPIGAYLKAKAAAEKLVVDSGIPYTILRPSTFDGEGHKPPPGWARSPGRSTSRSGSRSPLTRSPARSSAWPSPAGRSARRWKARHSGRSSGLELRPARWIVYKLRAMRKILVLLDCRLRLSPPPDSAFTVTARSWLMLGDGLTPAIPTWDVRVDSTVAVGGIDIALDGGAPVALAKQSDGSFTASLPAPAGGEHTAVFRADGHEFASAPGARLGRALHGRVDGLGRLGQQRPVPPEHREAARRPPGPGHDPVLRAVRPHRSGDDAGAQGQERRLDQDAARHVRRRDWRPHPPVVQLREHGAVLVPLDAVVGGIRRATRPATRRSSCCTRPTSRRSSSRAPSICSRPTASGGRRRSAPAAGPPI